MFNQTELTAAIAAGVSQALAAHGLSKDPGTYLDPDYAPLIGKIVFLRTVTMTNVGVLEAITPNTFIISRAVWVANSGRWANFCKTGNADEVEPFGDGPVWVAKAGIIDVGELPRIPAAKVSN